MNTFNNISLEKLQKLQEMALVNYQRCKKRYDLARGEWQECQKPYSIENNILQYEVSSRNLSAELKEQMALVEELKLRLEVVEKSLAVLRNSPEQASLLHSREIERAREKMDAAYQLFKAAEQRSQELGRSIKKVQKG